MLWFLNNLKHHGGGQSFTDKYLNELTILNEHINSIGKNNFKSLEEAFKSVNADKNRKELSIRKAIHTFKDGHSIVVLKQSDLHSEGILMSNCVGGYGDRLLMKERAVLALKSPKGDTLVHFEIMKNGALSQNFERANMPVRHKYWKYVYEFLKINSKNIPDSKHFGFVWRSSIGYDAKGINITSECVVPKQLMKHIDHRGKMATSIQSSEVLKNFHIHIPTVSFYEFDKNEFIKKLKDIKSDMIKSIDDIISSTEITEGENLYVSDKMKETLFGDGRYLMKGNGYNLLDMTMFSNDAQIPAQVEDVPVEIMEELYEAPRQMPRQHMPENRADVRPVPRRIHMFNGGQLNEYVQAENIVDNVDIDDMDDEMPVQARPIAENDNENLPF
jgi:hypothetical protein